MIKKVLKEALKIYPLVWRRGWPVILGLSLCFLSLKQFFMAIMPPVGSEILLPISLFLINLLEVCFWILILPAYASDVLKGVPKSHVFHHFKIHLGQVTIETFRAALKIMVGFLLLIVPGLIRSVRLYFVAYVVQFDAEYQDGKVDALARSEELTHGRVWIVAAWLVVVSLCSFLTQSVEGYVQNWQNLLTLQGVGSFALILVIDVYIELVLFAVYRSLNDSLEANRRKSP